MPLLGARAFGVVAAIASILALGASIGCSTGSGDAAAPAAAADDGDAGVAPSTVGASANDAAIPDDRTRTAAQDAAPARDADAGALAPFHIVGRFDTRDAAGPRFAWPGTELRARFSGPSLSVLLEDTGASHYDLSIDGAAPRLLVVTGGKQPYELAAGLPAGLHDVTVTRRTETSTGVTQLFGFVGTLVPSPVPAGRRMEVIGDSITCGYGVLGPDETCSFSAATESEPHAWGAVAAKQLGAMHSAIAASGKGVLRNYGGDTTNTMPDRYDRSLGSDPSSTWDHHTFEPDVIVVALGTNDFSGGQGDPGPAFQTTYASFLAALRAKHAQARIVAATSPMLSNANRTKLHAYVAGAIATRKSAGDTKVTLVDIDEQSSADGYGCSHHPSAATQKKMAAKLVAHVAPLMGW